MYVKCQQVSDTEAQFAGPHTAARSIDEVQLLLESESESEGGLLLLLLLLLLGAGMTSAVVDCGTTPELLSGPHAPGEEMGERERMTNE